MKTCQTIMSVLGMLTFVAVSSGSEQPSQRKPVVGPDWKPVEKSTILATGLKAHATYHFNRNALATACITDDCVLAVTDSGNLLRFDLKDLRLQQEIQPDAAITILSIVEGIGILAVCADGRVFRIDRKTLKRTEFAKLPAAPKWMVGFHDAEKRKNGVLAAVDSFSKESGEEHLELHRLGFEQPDSKKHKVPPPDAFNSEIGAYLLDRKSRLWLAKDGGEWGGWCGSLDLAAANASPVVALMSNSRAGVYGFVELPDGQVWAYGGVVHISLSRGFIARVDRGKLEMLGRYGEEKEAEPAAPLERPRDPITHIIPDPKGNGLLVFAYNDVFRVDAKLRNWRHLGSIEMRYRWGRPDAIGSYPALRTVHAVGDKSGDLICTTARDGLLRIKEGQVTQYLVPNQIGDDWIGTILPARGTSMLRGEDLWSFTGGSWQTISMFPSSPPNEIERWCEFRLMLDPERRPVALCRTNWSPGSAALTRW